MKKDLITALNQAALNYNQAAVLPNEIAQRLVEHLRGIRIEPKVILDLGAKTGVATKLLQERYPEATIICVDIAELLLRQTKRQNENLVCADIELLPFESKSIDFVFSNLSLFWFDFNKVFAEVKRVLKPNGLFIFSTFGPDTLHELKQSVNEIDPSIPLFEFTDMHHLGDALLKNGFLDPVMEMEYLQLTYSDLNNLKEDLNNTGCQNLAGEGLLAAKEKLSELPKTYAKYRLKDGSFPATFEIIYGHAWASAMPLQKNNAGEVSISIADIQRFSKN